MQRLPLLNNEVFGVVSYMISSARYQSCVHVVEHRLATVVSL